VTLGLGFIVATVVPFQFAFVIACLAQFASCVKALNRTTDVRPPTMFADDSFTTNDDLITRSKRGHFSIIHTRSSFS
jgi:hypothetical protein